MKGGEMSIISKSDVEVYRDGKMIIRTKANVQKGTIFFKKDEDVRELDIVKVLKTHEEFRVMSIYKQEGYYVEATVKRIGF